MRIDVTSPQYFMCLILVLEYAQDPYGGLLFETCKNVFPTKSNNKSPQLHDTYNVRSLVTTEGVM